MFTYIYKGSSHTDTTDNYMQGLGMTEEQIESVLSQKAFEEAS